MSVKERLTKYAKHKGMSNRSFSLSIGMSENYISSMRKSIQPDVVNNIALQYPDLNVEWLITGEGEMLKTGNIHVVGDGNLSNTGITGGDVIMGSDQEIKALKKRIKELEAEVKELKNDKAILKEFVTMLQNKK